VQQLLHPEHGIFLEQAGVLKTTDAPDT